MSEAQDALRDDVPVADPSLAVEVAARARADRLLVEDDTVLVAVSGGADSAALAGLLVEASRAGFPLRVTLGHVDHGWRGPQEAAADRAVVEELARRLSVPLLVAGPPEPVRRTEDAARRFRYSALARLAGEASCQVVATGHHLRDQAETFLLRLERGSGPTGLAGIPARRPLLGGALTVVRPLLWVDPERLRAYVASRSLPWRDDPTNALVDHDRQRIRARLTSLGTDTAGRSRDLAGAAERFAHAVERRRQEVATALGDSLVVHAEAAAAEVAVERVADLLDEEVATALRLLGGTLDADRDGPFFGRRHARLVGALAREGADGATVPLPNGFFVVRYGRRLLLARREAGEMTDAWLERGEHVEREVDFRFARGIWRESDISAFNLAAWAGANRHNPAGGPHSAALDAEELGSRVLLRAARPEDEFVPVGRRAKTSVFGFLSKQGVPGLLRRGVRVAQTEGGDVAWVVGHRIDARFGVGASTRRVALLIWGVERPFRLRDYTP